MSEHKQLGTATHLPGAEVSILDAGRHFGKIGHVVARAVFLGKLAAMVRVQTFRKGKPQIVHVAIPDAALERTQTSLAVKIKERAFTLAGTLAGALRPAGLSLAEEPSRRRLTAREYETRQARNKIASDSRKRNRG